MKLELRLSEAILLGSTAVKPIAGSHCEEHGGGCALTMAVISSGLVVEEPSYKWVSADKVWPWLNNRCGCRDCSGTFLLHIAYLFDAKVMSGDMTLEQLCDYVRSIEPAEPTISILPSRQPLVRIPEGSDQGDEQPEWDDTDTSRELYSGIQRGCQ